MNIDMNKLDTSSIMDFSGMFRNCTSLTSINIPMDKNEKFIIFWKYNNSGFCKIDDEVVFEFGDSIEIERLKNDRTLVVEVGIVDSDFDYFDKVSKLFPEYFV